MIDLKWLHFNPFSDPFRVLWSWPWGYGIEVQYSIHTVLYIMFPNYDCPSTWQVEDNVYFLPVECLFVGLFDCTVDVWIWKCNVSSHIWAWKIVRLESALASNEQIQYKRFVPFYQSEYESGCKLMDFQSQKQLWA